MAAASTPSINGHVLIAQRLTALFELDEFVFIPAFHAPHKPDRKPTSAYHRYAMLALATKDDPAVTVSQMELEVPERPYTVETLDAVKRIDSPIRPDIFRHGRRFMDGHTDLARMGKGADDGRSYRRHATRLRDRLRPCTDEIQRTNRRYCDGKRPAHDSRLTTDETRISTSPMPSSSTFRRANSRKDPERDAGWRADVPRRGCKIHRKISDL